MLLCKICWSRQKNEISQWFPREERCIHCSHRATHTKAQYRQFLGMGGTQHFFNGTRNIIEYVILKGQMLIFISRYSPIEHIDIKALLDQVFYQAIVWHQVQYIGAVDERVDQQNGNRKAFLPGWFIAIEFRL